MIKRIKIESVDKKPRRDGNGYFYIVNGYVDGNKYSGICFDDSVTKRIGDEIEVDISVRNNRNIINIQKPKPPERIIEQRQKAQPAQLSETQVNMMTLAYAKDIVVALIEKIGTPSDLTAIIDTVLTIQEKLLEHLSKSSLIKSKEQENKELDNSIRQKLHCYLNMVRERGFVFPEDAGKIIISRLGGGKEDGAFKPLNKFYLTDMTIDEKRILLERLETFHASCVEKPSACPFYVTGGNCKWLSFCLFYKNIDERRNDIPF